MSTRKPRRQPLTLPPWLTRLPRFRAGRDKDGKPERVTVMLTTEQRAGLDRILGAAKREHVQLSEGDVMREALDQLIAAVERFHAEPPVEPLAAIRQAVNPGEANTGSPADVPMREDGES